MNSFFLIMSDGTVNLETLQITVEGTVVPVPAAAWLFGSALVGLGWFKRKQTA